MKSLATKKILLISPNFWPEPTGIGNVNGEMMNWLTAKGYNCHVLTAFPYYPQWKVQAPYTNRWYKTEIKEVNGNPLTIHRVPAYIPANPSGKKRMLQDVSFWFSMMWVILKFIFTRNKFDVIINIAPPFHLAYLGLILRWFNGGEVLYHIQDLQIEAAQELNMLSGNKLFDRLYSIENDIMTKADYVSSISPGMIKKIKAKTEKDVIFFPNWVDTEYFYPLNERKTLKAKWGYKKDDIIYLYSGAIGEKQGLENIILTAEELQDDKKTQFIICGSGPYKEKLIKLADEKGLTNISFLPLQEKNRFNEFLNMADYHLILQKGNASDLVMPSKLSAVLAVGGVSIITTVLGTSLYSLNSTYDIGYVIEPDNHQVLSKLIQNLSLDRAFEVKGINAHDYAVEYLNIDNVMNKFSTNVLKTEPQLNQKVKYASI